MNSPDQSTDSAICVKSVVQGTGRATLGADQSKIVANMKAIGLCLVLLLSAPSAFAGPTITGSFPNNWAVTWDDDGRPADHFKGVIAHAEFNRGSAVIMVTLNTTVNRDRVDDVDSRMPFDRKETRLRTLAGMKGDGLRISARSSDGTSDVTVFHPSERFPGAEIAIVVLGVLGAEELEQIGTALSSLRPTIAPTVPKQSSNPTP